MIPGYCANNFYKCHKRQSINWYNIEKSKELLKLVTLKRDLLVIQDTLSNLNENLNMIISEVNREIEGIENDD